MFYFFLLVCFYRLSWLLVTGSCLTVMVYFDRSCLSPAGNPTYSKIARHSHVRVTSFVDLYLAITHKEWYFVKSTREKSLEIFRYWFAILVSDLMIYLISRTPVQNVWLIRVCPANHGTLDTGAHHRPEYCAHESLISLFTKGTGSLKWNMSNWSSEGTYYFVDELFATSIYCHQVIRITIKSMPRRTHCATLLTLYGSLLKPECWVVRPYSSGKYCIFCFALCKCNHIHWDSELLINIMTVVLSC